MRIGPALKLVKAGEAISASAWNAIVKALIAVTRMTVSPPLELTKDQGGWCLRLSSHTVRMKVKLQDRIHRGLAGDTVEGRIVDVTAASGLWEERGASFFVNVSSNNLHGYYFEGNIVDVELQADGTWLITSPGHYTIDGLTIAGGLQGEGIAVVPYTAIETELTAIAHYGSVDAGSLVGLNWNDEFCYWYVIAASCNQDALTRDFSIPGNAFQRLQAF